MKRIGTARAGFTLVEILAVLVIISILFAFVITGVMRSQDGVLVRNTEQFLAQVDGMLTEYELEFGDYPASTFPKEQSAVPNKMNMGGEMLVASLFSPKWPGREVPSERLTNSDGDATKSTITSFTSPDLFELCDDWQNPIAYFHRRDYGITHAYTTYDTETGEVYETRLKSLVDPVTKDPYNRTKYQLISAGPDGKFGTDDDIANFKINS